MRNHLLWASLVLTIGALGGLTGTAAQAPKTQHTTWTYTYLKATAGNVDALQAFIELNWFAMDRQAVTQGLFKDYRLGRQSGTAGDDPAWDLVVAVEYFGDQGYADIADAFNAIRAAHETKLVEGKDFRALGSVVRSERVQFLSR